MSVESPHQQQDKQRLERIQRRAARYVTNRYHNTSSVSDMLDQLEWPSLESRRTNSRLAMMYKMTKNIQISLEEADGRVCFVADVVDVPSPF
jgi:hypothetical protein